MLSIFSSLSSHHKRYTLYNYITYITITLYNFNNPEGSAGAGGDPHIKPFLGKPYSLPHTDDTFLLYSR